MVRRRNDDARKPRPPSARRPPARLDDGTAVDTSRPVILRVRHDGGAVLLRFGGEVFAMGHAAAEALAADILEHAAAARGVGCFLYRLGDGPPVTVLPKEGG